MKVRIKFQSIDETIEAPTPAALLSRVKQETAKRAPLFARPLIKGMSDLAFAAEAVKRANAAGGRNDGLPTSAQEFLDWGVERGYVTVEKD